MSTLGVVCLVLLLLILTPCAVASVLLLLTERRDSRWIREVRAEYDAVVADFDALFGPDVPLIPSQRTPIHDDDLALWEDEMEGSES